MAVRKPEKGEVEYTLRGGILATWSFVAPAPGNPGAPPKALSGNDLPAIARDHVYVQMTVDPTVYRVDPNCPAMVAQAQMEAEIKAEHAAQKALGKGTAL